jgi:hypothetical protein
VAAEVIERPTSLRSDNLGFGPDMVI